jgi:hypothetical protein
MDLREIQALHAQYTAQPVIIDIASHTAAMPALTAPGGNSAPRAVGTAIAAQLRKAGKPAVVAMAIAGLAAGCGMSAAQIWHAMHETVTAPKAIVGSASNQAPASTLASEAHGEMPLDVSPARPLTASDFETHKPAPQSALTNVDARSLAAPESMATVDRAAQSTRSAAENAAAASPIRASRPVAPAMPVTPTASTAEAQSRTPAVQTPAVAAASVPAKPAQTAPAPVASPAQETTKPEARPALRPLRHLTRHAAAAANTETATEPATPAQPKAQPAKSGDVQLF